MLADDSSTGSAVAIVVFPETENRQTYLTDMGISYATPCYHAPGSSNLFSGRGLRGPYLEKGAWDFQRK